MYIHLHEKLKDLNLKNQSPGMYLLNIESEDIKKKTLPIIVEYNMDMNLSDFNVENYFNYESG